MEIIDIPPPPRPPRPRRYSTHSIGAHDPDAPREVFLGQDKPVIKPLSVEFRFVNYQCDKLGLKTNGYRFDDDVARLIPRILKDDYGNLSIYQPVLRTHPPRYWRAQAAYRGFNPRPPLWDLLQVFRCSPNVPMLPELQEIETNLIEEYKILDAAKREVLWKSMSAEEKAKMDSQRFLKETFEDKTDVDVVVLKVSYRYTIHLTASMKNLHHTSTDAPLLPDGTKPKVHRWLVIGKTYDAVGDKIKEIKEECKRMEIQVEEAKLKKEEQERAEQQARESQAEKHARIAVAHARMWKGCHIDSGASPFDVVGRWHISAPRIDDEYGTPTQKCSLLLIHCKDDDGSCHMWAHFDFIALKGMFRFENPDRILDLLQINSDSESETTSNNHFDMNVDEENEDHDMDYEDNGEASEGSEDEELENNTDSDDDDSVSELNDKERISGDDSSEYGESLSIFYVGHNVKPSTALPTWDFRWRGHSKDGTFQAGSEEYLCTIRFKPSGSNGYTLEGLFYSDILGDFDFQGFKIFKKPCLNPFPNNPHAAIKAWNELAPPTPSTPSGDEDLPSLASSEVDLESEPAPDTPDSMSE